MFEAMWQGLLPILNPGVLLMIFLMAIYGLIIGILPGIGMLVAMAILLPWIFTLPMKQALIALCCVGGAGGLAGSITAILINIPGENFSVATLLDGYPMTKKGQGGRAIGAAAMGSSLSYYVSVLLAFAVLPLFIVVVKVMGTGEMCAMVLVGIAFVGVLGARGGHLKGIISGVLGFMLAFVGFQPNTGLARFTFGSSYLFGGLAFVTVILALFGTPSIIEIGMKGSIVEAGQEMPKMRGMLSQMWQGCVDVLRHFWLWLTCMLIGFVVGVVPAAGSGTAIWIAYGQAAKTSKHPELFGTGMVEGVMAPESARGAVHAGALLTTLCFGIPGSAGMVIVLGAIIVMGIIPGPLMVTEHLDLIFMMFLAGAISHSIGLIQLAFCLRPMLGLVYLKADYLVPSIASLVVVGAFAATGNVAEIAVLAVISVLAYFMRKYGYAPAAFALAYILGVLFERNFFLSLTVYGWRFLLRPIVLVLLLLAIYVSASSQLTAGARKIFKLVRG